MQNNIKNSTHNQDFVGVRQAKISGSVAGANHPMLRPYTTINGDRAIRRRATGRERN
jgi:hypothetical protein